VASSRFNGMSRCAETADAQMLADGKARVASEDLADRARLGFRGQQRDTPPGQPLAQASVLPDEPRPR
jgi:hypothetical protein